MRSSCPFAIGVSGSIADLMSRPERACPRVEPMNPVPMMAIFTKVLSFRLLGHTWLLWGGCLPTVEG
jgi:hypothetical protein